MLCWGIFFIGGWGARRADFVFALHTCTHKKQLTHKMAPGTHDLKVAEEVEQMKKDLVRLGTKNEDGHYVVKYGALFDDEFGQQVSCRCRC